MAKKRSITCDSCGKEMVEDTSFPHHYGLHLEARDYGLNTSGIQYAVAMYPPIEFSRDFCGTECLAEWLSVNA